VLYTFFAETTMGSVRSVVDSENLVRKIQFPRLVIPLAIVLLSLFNLSLNMVVVFIFALIEGVRPMLTWVELPLIVAMLAVLCTGVAMLLSAMFIYFRDIQPIWEVLLQVAFYASPVIIPFPSVQKALSPTLAHIYMMNPLATVLQQFRHAIINHATPSSGSALGSQFALVEPLAIVFAMLVLGFVVFNRTAPHVAEDL
jgi:ABC-2 type transport system permease protein